jgi:hypothetical protein
MPFAHSDADFAPQSLLRLSAYAGSRGMGNPDYTTVKKCLRPPRLSGTQRAKPAPRARFRGPGMATKPLQKSYHIPIPARFWL